MMRYIQHIFQDLKNGENIDLYVTVFIALGVASFNLFGIASGNLINSLSLAILALLVTSILGIRRRLEGVRDELKQVVESNKKLDSLLVHQQAMGERIENLAPKGIKLNDRTEFELPVQLRLMDAQTVDMLGYSLSGLASNHSGFLLQKAQSGCKFRFILLNPTSDAVKVASRLTEARQFLPQDIERTVQRLKPVVETGNAEIRYTSVASSSSLIIVDSEKTDGNVQVELFSYNVASNDLPHFVLTHTANKRWYDFFINQFENVWQDSIPCNYGE